MDPLGILSGASGNAIGDYFGQAFGKGPTQYQDQNQIHNVINNGLATSGNRSAPQMGYDNNPFRQGQLQQMQQLQGIASGQQMGAGELAAQRQTQNAMAGQQAMARMARGGNAALAYRGAANNAAGIGLGGAGLAQQSALQDQQNAQGMLLNSMSQGRGQDQSMQQANLEAQLRQTGMNDQQIQAYLAQLTGMNANELGAQTAAHNTQAQQASGLLSQGGQIIGSIASDERLKTDITPAGNETDALLDALTPYRYRYKDEKYGVGERIGIMAQSLERSDAGRRIVSDTPEGKMLDVNKALSAALASSARLNERVRALEGR